MDFSAARDAIVSFFTTSVFTAWVNFISVIGFVITILVYHKLKNIEKYYMFAGRATELAKELKQRASNISQHLNDFESNVSQLQMELVHVKVALQSLERKTDGELKRSVSSLLKDMKAYDPKITGSDGARSIYLSIVQVEAEITDRQKDQKWKSPQ